MLCKSIFDNFLCVVFELSIREVKRIYLAVKLKLVVNVYRGLCILKSLVDSFCCLLYSHAADIYIIDKSAGIESVGTLA